MNIYNSDSTCINSFFDLDANSSCIYSYLKKNDENMVAAYEHGCQFYIHGP